MGRIIYGGSFNPIHIGHLRLAIETLENMAPVASLLEFVPVGMPPHKDARHLLPFCLRAKLIRAAIANSAVMRCVELEAHRDGLSYTVDTLKEYSRLYPDEELFFLLGSQDFEILDEWRQWRELPGLANFVIAPRGGEAKKHFLEQTKRRWPEAFQNRELEKEFAVEGTICMRLPTGKNLFFLPIPRLDVSASRIRRLWLTGCNLEYLVPDSALALLEAEKGTVQSCWENEIQC